MATPRTGHSAAAKTDAGTGARLASPHRTDAVDLACQEGNLPAASANCVSVPAGPSARTSGRDPPGPSARASGRDPPGHSARASGPSARIQELAEEQLRHGKGIN